MHRTVGESVFEIWLAAVELLAVDRDGVFVLTGPQATANWVQTRFGRLISQSCERAGRRVRFATPQERAAIQHTPHSASEAVVGEQSTIKRRVS
jgi:hypothetical protein